MNSDRIRQIVSESISNMLMERRSHDNYTHFAVNKATGKIINGWNYSGIEPSELKMYKNDYFFDDLADNGFNPKDYTILTYRTLVRKGVDPSDFNNWDNI